VSIGQPEPDRDVEGQEGKKQCGQRDWIHMRKYPNTGFGAWFARRANKRATNTSIATRRLSSLAFDYRFIE